MTQGEYEQLRKYVLAQYWDKYGPDDIDDITQIAAIKLMRSNAEYKSPYLVAKHAGIDFHRRAKRFWAENIDDYDVSSDDEVNSFDKSLILLVLNKLPEPHRTVMDMAYIQDLTESDISTITGLSTSWIGQYKTKAKKMLRRKLGGGP